MKILDIPAIKECDRYTVVHEPVASVDLMERAANALKSWLMVHDIVKAKNIKIFCGMGNNGGDGLALARLLSYSDISSEVYLLRLSERFSPDCETNYLRIKDIECVKIFELFTEADFPVIDTADVVIDAVLGSGLNKPLQGVMAQLAEYLNDIDAVKIAVDIPSGMFADRVQPCDAAAVKTDYTLTFQFPKLSFLFAENDSIVGEWHVLDIGLHRDFIDAVETDNFFTTEDVVRPILRSRPKFSHKGTYGHALLVAGSEGMSGACLLSAESCMRSGTGLLTVHLPSSVALPLMSYLPEAISEIDSCQSHNTAVGDLSRYTAIGMGPGLGRHSDTAAMIKSVLRDADVPIVLDADALNILSDNKTWLEFLPAGTILTPHPKEFERLFGTCADSLQRLDLQRKMAMRYNIIIVLKGAYTSVMMPNGKCFFNSTGNPGMAKAGSGDVLTGIILSLLAQHYSPEEAAVLGVYVHGLAGDVAASRHGMYGMLSSDISECLGDAFLEIAGRQ